MNGLLYKDMVNLTSTLKFLVVIILVFCIVFLPLGNEIPLLVVLTVFAATLPTTAISYDATAKWDKYVVTTPLTRREIVKSKYLLMLAALLIEGGIVLLISTAMLMLMPGRESLLSEITPVPLVVMFVAFGLLLGSTVLPLVFKFGAENMQYILLIIVMVPVMVFIGLVYLAESSGIEVPSLAVLLAAAVVAAAAGCWISYRISTGIYAKKEW